jgi:eukaryotic-like serine/threonine-protein kinase
MLQALDPDVAELVRAERMIDAARLVSERGDAHGASLLYERACDWVSAAREALRAGERRRAMELAVESGDEPLCESVVALLDPQESLAAARRLTGRGRDRWAARLLDIAGDPAAAAAAWERAGAPLRAAELLERAGNPGAAAKVLEGAIRHAPEAWPMFVALGSLLARFGKHEAAVRTLQRVPPDAPDRGEALALLVPALQRIGLSRAASEAATELAEHGERAERAKTDPVSQEEGPPRARLFGRYDVVREAASSPSARVLECVDVVRGERIAVKVFAAWGAQGAGRDALVRFEREVRAMRGLDHPNVVPLREFLPEGPAIALAWMGGGTLERLLATAGRLPPARAIEIATSVLTALGEAHRLGVVHRDVKPSNVLFDDAGGARLSDFGVAHLGDASTTATAGVFGTLAYMSPEQREGRPATPRSDLFSVGVVLREMLTGQRPAASDGPRMAPSGAHAELDARHDAVVDRLTARDPAGRPVDAFEARAALLALPWPAVIDPSAPGQRSERRSSAWPQAGRLQVDAAGAAPLDTWTGRRIERIPLTDAVLAGARSFARAGHPALQCVLRIDREDDTLWLESPAGGPAPPQAKLSPAQRAVLASALAALHAAGGVHGQVDAAHVLTAGSDIVLRFGASADPTATADRDWLALSRL